jgi:peptidylprolyl isomerase/FKBP-type peptidyl-prolyl cis-trans isomerase FklB
MSFSKLILSVLAFMALSACGPASRPKPNPAEVQAGQAFLAANAKAPGVHVTADGLQYKIVTSGPADGARPGLHDEVKVNYEGRLLGQGGDPNSGQVFDSSFKRGMPADFAVDRVVPGWTEALQLMRPGDEWVLYLPSSLAYGDSPPPGAPIPPGAVLIFRVQLLGALHHSSPP